MAISDQDLQRIRAWSDGLVPEHVADQVRMELDVTHRHVTLMECRPPWNGAGEWRCFPIARLRFTVRSQLWSLYWRDRNERFHLYERLTPTADLDEVLECVSRDEYGIFWG